MQVFTAEQTRDRLPYAALAAALEDVLAAGAAGQARAPERFRVDLAEGGMLLLMPALDADLAITKIVSVHPGNRARQLPMIQGEVVVMNARTGTRLGVLDGATVSARRTAALSLLAAQRLAPVKHGPLLVVGAGVQARAHIEAFHEGLGLTEVYVQSRTRKHAEALAAYASQLGMRATPIDRVEDAPDRVRLFVTATTSRVPVLPDVLPWDAFVAAVGAFKPDMAELSPTLIANGSVIVDTLEGAKCEAGDLIQAAASGTFRWDEAQPLQAVVGNAMPRLDGPVLFKSVGQSLWDLAAARLAFAAG